MKIFTSLALASAIALSQVAPAQTHHHHHRLAKIVGGVAAYKIAKKTGKNRVAHGRHRNFFQKHPMIAGAAGAYAAGKIAKHRHHHSH